MSAHKVNRDLYNAGKSGIATKCYDASGNIAFSSGPTIPSGAGYAYGSLFVQNDVSTPGAALQVNVGSATSATFLPQNAVGAILSIPIPFSAVSGSMVVGDNHMWVAPGTFILNSITCIYSLVSGVASTARIFKAPSGTPLAGGTVLHTTVNGGTGSTFDFTKAANTTQAALITGAVATIAAGDSIGAVVATATPTNLYGGVFVLSMYPA